MFEHVDEVADLDATAAVAFSKGSDP